MGIRKIADHTSRIERLWANVRDGLPLQSATEIATAIAVCPSTVSAWFAQRAVARVRMGCRMFSTTDMVIESLRANEILRDGLKEAKKSKPREVADAATQRKLTVQERMSALGLDRAVQRIQAGG